MEYQPEEVAAVLYCRAGNYYYDDIVAEAREEYGVDLTKSDVSNIVAAIEQEIGDGPAKPVIRKYLKKDLFLEVADDLPV